MKRLLTSVAIPIVVGAFYFGSLQPVDAAIVESFCGPQPVGGCATGSDLKVFLQPGKDQLVVKGNVGGPSNSNPEIDFASDINNLITVTLDSGGGFSTITPAKGFSLFHGLDITIPGHAFTGLVFSAQLPNGLVDTFTLEGFDGAHHSDGFTTDSDAANTDKEFSIREVGGFFDEVNIFSAAGFNEIKQIEVSGICTILANGSCTPSVIDAPEPLSLTVLGVGLLGLAAVRRRA